MKEEQPWEDYIPPLQCMECGLPNCNGYQHLDDYMNSIGPGLMYPCCNNCGVELNDLIELMLDSSLRSKERCEICSKVYSTKAEESVHFLSHFNKKLYQTFYCIQCTDPTAGANSLAIMECSDDYECEMCPSDNRKTYRTFYGLVRHKREKHNINVEDILEYSCSHCPRSFSCTKRLSVHMSRVHKKRKQKPDTYKCRVCDDLYFHGRLSRQSHENEQHKNPETGQYDCMYCERTYTCISHLELHLLSHTKKKNHYCDVCGKGFGRITHLEVHALIHTDQKDFVCTLCTGKSFKTLLSLKRHISYIHTDRPRYPCELCDKTFKDSSDRRRHRWSHGGYEKKFQCPVCEKKFYENKLLRNHMKNHIKENPIKIIKSEPFP